MKSGASVDNNLIALVMIDDTESIIKRLQSLGASFNINDKVNVRGDTLLHYASKRNNQTLIRYLLSQPNINKEPKNDLGKIPKELAPNDAKHLFP